MALGPSELHRRERLARVAEPEQHYALRRAVEHALTCRVSKWIRHIRSAPADHNTEVNATVRTAAIHVETLQLPVLACAYSREMLRFLALS